MIFGFIPQTRIFVLAVSERRNSGSSTGVHSSKSSGVTGGHTSESVTDSFSSSQNSSQDNSRTFKDPLGRFASLSLDRKLSRGPALRSRDTAAPLRPRDKLGLARDKSLGFRFNPRENEKAISSPTKTTKNSLPRGPIRSRSSDTNQFYTVIP